jgi:L-asparaginase / beta-aspartyl-peptidase
MSNYRKRLKIMALVLISTAVLVAPAASSSPSEARDRAAITKAITEQQSAWNQADINAFLTAYWHSPDVTFSGTSGLIRGWDAVLARYKKTYVDHESMGQLNFSQLEFRFLGKDAALVLGHWHLTRAKGDIGGVFSLVWQRFPEGWRIIHDHTSAVPDAK